MKTLKVSFIYLITVFTFVLLSGCSKEENPAGGGNGGGGGGGGGGSTTVTGTLTMPAAADGKPFWVLLYNDDDSFDGNGTVGTGMTLNYTVNNVPAGDYFVLANVYLNGGAPGDDAVSGDYIGFYDVGGGVTNPNASVPSSGNVTFDFSLFIQP